MARGRDDGPAVLLASAIGFGVVYAALRMSRARAAAHPMPRPPDDPIDPASAAPDGFGGELAAALDFPIVVVDHWLSGDGVARAPIDSSWYGGRLAGGAPGGVVWHYTATDPGTAAVMARHRTRPFAAGKDRAASWHVSIESDGSVLQHVPLDRVAYHAEGDGSREVPGLGRPNARTVGIELVGHGARFPPAQVASAGRVLRAIARTYGVPRSMAMLSHSSINPDHRSDPGPAWESLHAPGVLAFAYA